MIWCIAFASVLLFAWTESLTQVSSTNLGSRRFTDTLEELLHGEIRELQRENDSPVCSAPPSDRVREANFTPAEAELLPSLCWNNDSKVGDVLSTPVRKGIPSGVTCKATTWYVMLRLLLLASSFVMWYAVRGVCCRCDHDGLCTEVCERGSVEVERWLKNAINTQVHHTLTHRM